MSSMRLNLDSRLRLVTSRQSTFEKSRDDAPACNNSITCMSVNKTRSPTSEAAASLYSTSRFLFSSPPHLLPFVHPSPPFTAKMAKTTTGSLNSVLPRKILFFLAISQYRSRSRFLISHSNSNNHESRHQDRRREDDYSPQGGYVRSCF